MALIVTPPEIIGFSKDRIIWQFEDDREGIIPGIPAENLISFIEDVLPGAQIVIRWDDKDLRFTASDAPNVYGAEFPTYTYNLATMQAYIESLVPYFQNNYFINEDFIVSAFEYTISGPLGSATFWTLKFTARESGTRFNFSKTRFAGGGAANWIAGTDDSEIVNNSVFMELWFADGDAATYQRIYKAALQLNNESKAFIDVAPLLHSYLTPEVPDFLLPVAQKCKDSCRKYYIRYAPAGGETIMIGKLENTTPHVVVLGGFGERKGGPQSLPDTFKSPATLLDKLLTLQKGDRYIRQDEPVFVSWINFSETARNVHARATLTFSDGSSITTNTNVVSAVGKHEKVVFSVGFTQFNLNFFNGTKTVREYSVQLRDDLGFVSEPLKLIINYAHKEYVRYFAHINSYGSIETLATYGKGSSSWKVFKESAEKVIPYQFPSTEAQFVEWNLQFQESSEVATGWIRKKELAYFLDFFISPLKFRVTKGTAYNIAVNSDTIQRGTDGENMYALVFEYQFQRLYDSLSEEEMEGDDVQDYIPANVVLANNSAQAGTPNPPPNNQRTAVDPYPISGSENPVSSNGVYRLLQQYQPKLPQGSDLQYITGDGKLKVLKTAVNAAEIDPTVPSYAKTLTGFNKIFDELQAMNPGLNVNLFGGQIADWYVKRMTHPDFSELPPIVVQKGQAFTKYLDLKNYKTSYHPNEDLSVDLTYNSLRPAGVEITHEGELLIKLAGLVNEDLTPAENAILAIKDLFGNQVALTLRIQTIEEPDPEIPDNRPVCPAGPFHYPQTAIQIINNGRIRCPFDAMGVPQVRWKIVNFETDTMPLRSGMSVNDSGPYFIAEFEPLPGKTYKIGIQGDLCKSPWVYRDLVLPVDNTLNWSEGYPKYESHETYSEFLAKIDQSIQALTELFNITTNTKVYSALHDYVADVTEISVPKTGGWPDAYYRFSVGALSEIIKVGSPVDPPSFTFKLVKSWDGSTIKDLSAGPYEGPVPSEGFNIYFQSNQLGFLYNYLRYKTYLKVSGSYVEIPLAGGAIAVTGTSGSVLNPVRIFSSPGVDSRFVLFNGTPINRAGEFKTVFEFLTGGASGTVVNTKEQTFKFNKLEVKGGVVNTGAGGGRIVPALGRVQYNGVNVVNNNAWVSPFTNLDNLEYNINGASTWYSVSAWFDIGGTNDVSNVRLLNSGSVDLFPPGLPKTIRLRIKANPDIVSDSFLVDFGGSIGGTVTAKTSASGYPVHMNLVKTKVSGGYNINDTSSTSPPEGYHNLYIMNRELNAMEGSLTDYFYDNNMPLGVYKIQRKDGVTDLYPWHGNGPDADETLAQAFSDNCSIAFEMIIFNRK
jgi:hypothetical protein